MTKFKSLCLTIRTFIALIFLGMATGLAAQQTVTISGTVTDTSGEPLAGVTVLFKGSSIGTATDIDGRFSIKLPPPAVGKILNISYIGYEPLSVPLTSDDNLSIVLKEDSRNLDEVVVVGYGTQKKINLTGSVSSLSSEDLASRPVTSTSAIIAGLVPGVSVIQNSGRPGAGANVKMRGTGTFSSAGNSPLVLIDGLSGNLDDVDPNDIQNISFLKDAASASIYGSRAANGVILIETKKGAEGKSSISYNNNFGWQCATELPEFLDSWEYATYYNMAMENMGNTPAYTSEQIQKFRDGSDPDNYPNANHLKWLLNTGSGFQQQHNVGFSSVSGNTSYNLSLGYRSQEGMTAKTTNKRLTGLFSMESKLKYGLTLTLNINAYHNKYDAPMGDPGSIDGIIGYAVREAPIYAGQKSDGSFGYQDNYSPEAWLAGDSFTKSTANNMSGSVRLRWDTPLKGLSLQGKIGANYYNAYSKSYRAETYFDENKTVGPTNLDVSDTDRTYSSIEALAQYTNSFGRHNLNVLAGYSFESWTDKYLWGYRNTFPTTSLSELVSGDASTANNTSSLTESTLMSFFGRVNYNFDERYLLEANLRYDGSSHFAKNKRWGVFPSVSAAWRISQETFWKESPIASLIDNFKIRVSHGTLGNQNIGAYAYQQTYWYGYNYPLGNPTQLTPGAVSGPYNDPDITWEKTRITDVGIDFSLWNSRLTGTIDYFYKYTSDILSAVEVSDILGNGVGNTNIGAVSNRGIEVNLVYNGSIGNDFRFSVSPNFTWVKNAVEKLSNGAKEEINNGRIVGEPLGIIYGYKTDGLFVDQAEIDAAPDQIVNKNSLKPGYVKYKDISGPDGVPDGKVDADYDRTILGSTTPKFYYGMTLTAKYKGFDFSALLQGVGGHKRLIGSYMAYAFYNGGQIQRWQADNCWTVDNPNKWAEYPRLETLNMNNPNLQTSDYWVRDASFLRIKNITIGYTIPKNITKKFGFETIRVYVSGDNLHTFNKFYKGWDPENEIGTGDAPSFYPIASVYSFGFNFKL